MTPPLYPPHREKMDPKDFERIPIGDFVKGTIKKIDYEATHEFKGQFASIDEAVRFVYEIDGLKFSHYSRWMKFSYSEKSNLYTKYLIHLVEGIKPDAKFDLRSLEGLRVKMVWIDDPKNPDYQRMELITPLESKVLMHAPALAGSKPEKELWSGKGETAKTTATTKPEEPWSPEDDEVPF